MQEHELRRQVVSEMHLRRWPVLSVPSLIIQWVLSLEPEEREEEGRKLAELPTSQGLSIGTRHRSGEIAPGVQIAWERHSEGSSVALFFDGLDADGINVATQPEIVEKMVAWAQGLPGHVQRATRIQMVRDDKAAQKLLPKLDFTRSELISCHFGDKVRMWGDFRLRADGYGKLLVAANGTDMRDLTRYVQRLQELGNYRNRALIGLPVAQAAWPRLDAVGVRVSQLSQRVAGNATTDDALLEELSSLSMELSAIDSEIDYRMSATAAYAQLVRERLEKLNVKPIDGFMSLADFTERRFLPAIRTCASVTERVANQSARAERLASLLRARINTRIENQNARLLRSMDESARMQLRLQQLVEGLSVVALSYYLLGLVAYGLKGAQEIWPSVDADIILAVIALPTVIVIWLVIRALKVRLLDKEADGGD